MCCGKYDGLAEAMAAPPEVVMAKVYTTRPGDVKNLSGYGEATNKTPAMVPDKVAAQFEDMDGFKVEMDDPKAAKKVPKSKGRKARKE